MLRRCSSKRCLSVYALFRHCRWQNNGDRRCTRWRRWRRAGRCDSERVSKEMYPRENWVGCCPNYARGYHISTSFCCKETDTHTYLHHQSSHPSHCKTGLPRSQLLRLRRLCSEESDFLEKGGEMVSFFEQRGYSPALLRNDLYAIRQTDRTDVLNNHRPLIKGWIGFPWFSLTIH